MGVFVPGMGLLLYVFHESISCGGDMLCTCIYLALKAQMEAGRPLGRRFSLVAEPPLTLTTTP